jgi:hypothetical protein
MKILIILALITALLLWYALQGRDWLKSKPWAWARGFFAWIEPIEITLFKKSETILAGRTLAALGGVLTFLTQFGEIDLTPIMPFVPEKYQPFVSFAVNSTPMLITAIGWMVERLRNRTTKPIELVAVPDKVVAESPALQEAIAMADDAKVEAVAVTAEAVAEAKAA